VYEWTPKKPTVCPKCHSLYWDKERRIIGTKGDIRRTPWSYKEVETLIKYGGSESVCELQKRLPNRERGGVEQKRQALGIKYNHKQLGICYPVKREHYLFLKVNGKYKAMHRIIMEEHLGRKLKPEEKVHHIDGDGHNNNINNLHLCDCDKTHRKIHGSIYRIHKPLIMDGIISFDKDKEIYVYDRR